MLHTKYVSSITKKKFIEESKKGHIPPIYTEIQYTIPEYLYNIFSGRNSFLFESLKGSENIARYSFIGFDPYMIFKVKDGIVELDLMGDKSLSSGKPLHVMNDLLSRYKQIPQPDLPLFQGGAAGFFSYDFVHYLERLPKTTFDDLKIPDAHFFMIDKLIAFDHKYQKAWVIMCPGLRGILAGLSESYDESEYQLNIICNRIDIALGTRNSHITKNTHHMFEIIHEMKKEDYMDMVKRAKEYIAAGDIFQANLSLRVSAFIGELNPWSLYRMLREINPAPFAGFVDFGDYSIVSSSPERLVRVKDRIVETRPIAGTRPRGRDVREDEDMREELLLNEKERAEHIMLIDLERNDLGKVSDYGSIKVDELMITEDYSHVIHIVSNIRSRLAPDKTCLDVIKAVFPGGTITGVPKVRCMEIIDELEPVRRGPYTGSMGYIGFSGNMDTNIIIRTFVIKNGYAYVQAGAGIVADSDPEREYYESLKKAEALIKTLERI